MMGDSRRLTKKKGPRKRRVNTVQSREEKVYQELTSASLSIPGKQDRFTFNNARPEAQGRGELGVSAWSGPTWDTQVLTGC